MGTSSVKAFYPGPELSMRDTQKIVNAFLRVLEEHRKRGNPLAPFVDDSAALEWLNSVRKDSSVVACRDAETLELIGVIFYSIEPFEWGTCSCLMERLVLSVADAVGFGRVALEVLERIAKEQYCPLIISGNALSLDQQLTENLYTRKGSFSFSHKSFVKVLS